MKIALIAAITFAALSASTQVTITPSVKDGDKISGIVVLRATVSAKGTVNQVEFYVNGELRSTDTSTPYTYTLDTLPEKEGKLKVEIGAYTSSGDSKKVVLNLTVDNELAKGAKWHTENAQRFLNVSKWDDAVQAARVALKADENYNGAKIAMARAFLGKGQYDKAQQWAEDAVITEENEQTTELLAGIHAERAFNIISMSGDRGDALVQIINALKAAITQRTATINYRLKAAGAVNDANRLKVVDLLMQKHDYSAARRLLTEKWNEGAPDLAIGNRLIYATMRSGRMTDANRLIGIMKKKQVMDATTYALLGAGKAYYRLNDESAAAIKDGGFDDPDSPALMSASAYLALMKNDKAAANSQVSRMVSKDVNAAGVYFYLSTLMFFSAQPEARDYFKRCIILDPLCYDMYVERGYEALDFATRTGEEKDKPVILDSAKSFFELALVVRPDSAEALNGVAITQLYKKNYDEALKMAQAAVSAGPEYPWTHFTLAAAFNAKGDYRSGVKEVDKGGELDSIVLKGRNVPSTTEAWAYTYKYARLPLIVMQ